MRKLIIKLLYGNDELALRAFELVQQRREVISLADQRKRLAMELIALKQRLVDKAIEMNDAREDYFDLRHEVEIAANEVPL